VRDQSSPRRMKRMLPESEVGRLRTPGISATGIIK
jgi:hypothetical protein